MNGSDREDIRRLVAEFTHNDDYYSLVPKEFFANLDYRERITKLGSESRENAEQLWIMCARDLLFFVNTFGWIYEPRRPAVLPFLTWEFQDEIMPEINAAIGKTDFGIEKSRAMAATWMVVTVFTWRWIFKNLQDFLFVSRNEDAVDKSDDPATVFWKFDFLVKNLPGWLAPNFTRTKLHALNNDNGSVIDGSTTTGNLARGDRRTAILMDEYAAFASEDGYRALASTQSVTNSRFYVSTPLGAAGAFFDVMHDPNLEMIRKSLHWPLNPLYAKGLYTSHKGKLEILDSSYKFPADYPFILDNKPRSPWYDRECRRTPIPQLIAQELDIDYGASDYQFFDKAILDQVEANDVREPYAIGELEYDEESLEDLTFVEKAKGNTKLWMQLDAEGRPPRDRTYAIGVDVSLGTGSTNSILSGTDMKTGEKILELASARLKPHQLAKVAVAYCKWLAGEGDVGAFLIWEANGPGRLFGDAVIDLGYRHLWYRRNEQSLAKKGTDVPGWYSTKEGKLTLLGDYQRALATGQFVQRSKESVKESRLYIILPDRSVAHRGSVGGADPTGARDNHGDRVIADAVVWRAMKERAIEIKQQPKQVPANCFLARRQSARRRARADKPLVWSPAA